VCFRLADSLPRSAAEAWRRERAALLEEAGASPTPAQKDRLRELFAERVEQYLDSGHGTCWLRRPEIARIAADALRHFDGERYQLLAWCIMPNHVPVVVRPLERHTLPEILKSWKGFSGKEASRLLSLHGEFWQPEYYDHLIRDATDLAHAMQYVEQNPAKAGLTGWPWVWVGSRLIVSGARVCTKPLFEFTGPETRAT
jgi:REP element-mobilizing transposase RayT